MEHKNKNSKNTKKNKKENKHKDNSEHKSIKVIKRNKANTVHQYLVAIKNVILSNTRATLKQVMATMKINETARYEFTKKFLRETTHNFFGTWEPEHKFVQYLATNVASATGVITTVNSITNQGLALYDEFEVIFDEVRPTGPFSIHYFNGITNNSTYPLSQWAVGVIDYADGTALPSVEVAMSYDTHKCFVLNPVYTGWDTEVRWEGRIQGTPDRDWIATSATGTYAYWKAYNFFNVSGTTTYGVTQYRIVMQFRQIGGGS